MLEDIFYRKMNEQIKEVRSRMVEDDLRYEKLKKQYPDFFNNAVKNKASSEDDLAAA